MEEGTLYLQLHKLSAVNSEEALEDMLLTLWKTRKTGLRSSQKSHVQSILNLSSLGDVDPVLACLRSLIRRCVHDNFAGEDLLKLFPPDLSLDLQSILILLFQKFQNLWKEELSKEQHLLPRTSISYQVKTNVPPSFTSIPSVDISTSPWPRQGDPSVCFNLNGLGASTTIAADANMPLLAPLSLQHDVGHLENTENIPFLKSMTWTVENQNSPPANRVATIILKLQDCTKTPSGEMEVKFQLTRDTLEAMLRSLAYINEQLSSKVGSNPGPMQKKQKQ